MKIVFLGSGEFSRDLLVETLRHGLEISAVITRPDRPAGRGLKARPTAVKDLAEREGVDVFQPDGPGDPVFREVLDRYQPQVLLVADYGFLLPRSILEYPPMGCVNVHPSLLPRFRGAAPIQRAIMQGELKTGVSVMLLDEGMDSGPIIASEEVVIEDEDNALTLRRKLAQAGGRVLVEELPRYVRGEIIPRPQDERLATFAEPIRKADMVIDWNRDASSLHNQIRALSPRPGAYTELGGKRIKILRSRIREDIASQAPGRMISLGKESFAVGTAEGALQVEELQPEGKKLLSAAAFLRGYRVPEGEFFGGSAAR